jgi:hypothetical protein
MRKTRFVLFALSLFYVAAFAQKGSIQGRVFDVKSNVPLEFCTITLQGTPIGSTSDLDGKFLFTGIEPGFYRIEARFVGYESALSSEIQVKGNQTTFVELPMVEKALTLKDVVVSRVFNIKKLDSPLSLSTIGVQDLEKTAGVNRDVSKVVQTLPGVGPTSPQRNDLIVRGGGPSENVFYLDGVEIPVINHFATQGSSGGAVGVLNADFVREINFYTGAFPANRGNALSSVMDIKQRDGDKDRTHAAITLGASDAGVTVDGPLGPQTTYIASVRQSYLQFLFDAIGLPFLPTYTDFQFKVRTFLDPKNELTVLGVGAIDDMTLNTTLDNPTESQRYVLAYLPIYEQWNYTVGAVYKHYSEAYFDTWVLSRNMLRNHYFKYLDNEERLGKTQDYRSDEAENKLRFERSYPDLPVRLLVGASVKYAHYTNRTFQQLVLAGAPQTLRYQTDLNVLFGSLFAQASDSYLDDALKLSLGVSVSANGFNGPMRNPLRQCAPRLSGSYAINGNWTLNANVGRYVMAPSYTSMGYRNAAGVWVNRNDAVRYTGSNQAVLGLEYVPRPSLRVSVEGFYKGYDHYALSVKDGVSMASKGTEYGSVGNEEIRSKGKGRAYGVEGLVKVSDGKRINLTATYTLFRSEFTDASGIYRPSAWDTRSVVNVLGGFTFRKSLKAGLRWRMVGGAPYTPIDPVLSSLKAVWDVSNQPQSDFTRYNALRLKGANILDLRLDKEFYFKHWMLNAYLDVQNVLNAQTETPPNYTNLDAETGTPLTDPSDASRYSLRRIDNLGGNVLPTLGIMVRF